MATPGQARLSLVRASPCPRLMRGLPGTTNCCCEHALQRRFLGSPAGRHQHRRSGRRWQAVEPVRGTGRGPGCRQRRGGGLPSASLTRPAGVGVADDATLEVRTYPTFTSSLEALADWLQAEGVRKVVMEATGQQLEADLVGAGGTRVPAAVGQCSPRPGSCPAVRPTSAMRPGLLSCWGVGCCGAAWCPHRRSASCGILSAIASGPFQAHGAEVQRVQKTLEDAGIKQGLGRH
jgi:hypothetical protein